MRIQQQLVQDGDDGQYLSDLALSHNNLGLLQSETGATAAADGSFHEAIRLQEQLVASDPHNAEHQRNLAASCNNLGGLSTQQDPERACESFARSVKHLSLAVAERPDDLAYKSELALFYGNLASAPRRPGIFRLPRQLISRPSRFKRIWWGSHRSQVLWPRPFGQCQ